jgi:hypothetical protein
VALLAKTRKDIDKYASSTNAMRYNFAMMIATAWFDKIDQLTEEGIDIEELKNDLNGKTMIGEYCGHPDYQHLVIYPEVRVIFYTIVDNNSEYSCILPEESYAIFKKYKLECVTFESLGVFSTYEDLKDCLMQTYRSVSAESIQTGEEGSVIYFVRRRKDSATQGEDRVLSLGKLKTLEYRMYRKLREKLKTMSAKILGKGGNKISEKQSWNTMVTKFRNEGLQLNEDPDSSEGLISDKDFDYYVELAELAAKKCYDNPAVLSTVKDSYLGFLKELIDGKYI